MLRRVGLIGAVIAVTACGGDAAVTPEAQTGLRFTVRSVSDTIETLLAAPLELQLNDDAGAPRSGVAVTVTGPGEPGATRLLTALGTPSQQMVTVTTDATGRARVWARFGGRVGREWVRASAGTSVDSLAVDILVGQLANLIAEPADTAMWVGQSFQIRTQVTDRRNNPRSDAVTFTATGDAAAVSSTGVITGTAIGRGTVTASVGSRTTTVFASVVPQATLAVYAEAQLLGQDAGIYVIRSDGSGGRWAFKFSSTGSAPQSFGLWPTWSADGKRIVFTHSATLRIIQADGSGLRDLVTPGGPLPVANDYAPQFGKDGWIHFTRGQFGSQRTFWRVREDGSGLVQTSEQRGWGVEAMPTPSPTSDAVAYQTNDITNSPIQFTLRIIASSTGVIRKLDLPGYSPRWSPTGNRIGYLDDPDRLNFLDANGTPLGQVGGRIVPLQPGFSWSSDGAWVIGVGGSTGPVLRIVNTTSGLVLPLAFRGPDRQMLIHPSWQPTP